MSNKTKQEPISKDTIFEQMFEKQVHDFVEQHDILLRENLNLFQMAKKFEERYDYVIETAKKRINDEISNAKLRNSSLHEELMNQRKELIEKEMEKLTLIINNTIQQHLVKNQEDIAELEKLYHDKKKELIDDIIKQIGINY